MNRTIHGNFEEILKEILAETNEGKINFQGPSGGFVSVTYMNGKILAVDSTWGSGKDELQKISEWNNGDCIINELTPEEKMVLKLRGETPVPTDNTVKDAKATFSLEHPVEVQSLFRDLKGESIDSTVFLSEILKARYSGEARVATSEAVDRILFYRGLPLLTSDFKNLTMREAADIMNVSGATLNFYILGDELAHAFSSVLQGERLWQDLTVTVLNLDEMLNKLMEKQTTGHLCIHKASGDHHYLFFSNGSPLGIYDLEQHWRPVEISSIWEGAEQVDYYRSWEMEPLLATSEAVLLSENLERFIAAWNELIEGIVRKVGRKPVEKSLIKNFGYPDVFSLEGIWLQFISEESSSIHQSLKAFREGASAFLQDIESIVGSHWLSNHLQDFQDKKGDLIAKLDLVEVFLKKGD